MQILVDLGREVLVEQPLELLVLPLQVRDVADQATAVLEQRVVLVERLLERVPHAESLVGDDARHALPELTLLAPGALLTRLLGRVLGRLDALAAALPLRLMLLDERFDRLDRVVGVDELVVVGVGKEVRQQLLDIACALDAENLEDRIDLEQILLVGRQRFEQLLDLPLNEEARLVAQQLEHVLDVLVVHLPARDRPAVALALARRLRRPLARRTALAARLEDVLRRREPAQAELLLVDDLVGLQHAPHQVGDCLLVHLPHVAVSLRVRHLKVLELALQVLELLGDPLVLVRQVGVLLLEAALLARVLGLERRQHVGHARELLLLLLDRVCVLRVALDQHAVVVVELLLVELVGGAHLLQLLLERLDLRLQLDLQDVVVLRVLHALRLELPQVLVDAPATRLHVVLLLVLALLHQLLQLRHVRLHQLVPLLHERRLHLLELVLEGLAQGRKLLAHPLKQQVNVLRLLLERLDILVVLRLELRLELLDQPVLGLDDPLARVLLQLDLGEQLLRDLLVEES
mmetsp:Transcript_19357/g.52361  ORF Transcript_19357/g.52361 Transcript_19357/m.52361 type:complete len:520 (-) Transcript_19357:315-1874(-)